jgi:hypothetical protein
MTPHVRRPNRSIRVYAAAAVLLAAFLVIYLPDVGHGFIKDDFGWIAGSRLTTADDVRGLFEHNAGFYRPLVSASFAADYALWRFDPFAYGITNLVAVFVDAVLLFCLARKLSASSEAALVAVAAWSFNFHGVNMALLWISGRTALLLCMFALCVALAVLSGRTVLAGCLSLLAMLCKEEAVMVPVLFVLVDLVARPHDQPPFRAAWSALRRSGPLWIALAIYLGLRAHSGAFGPQDAPSYYRFTFEPLAVVRNVLEYLDRGATLVLAIAVAMLISIGTARVALTAAERAILRFGAAWFVCFYAMTVFLPVRSSLYALTPSAGAAVALAAVASAVQRVSRKRFEICCGALMAVIFLLVPIYRQRNERWVVPADLSTRVVRTLRVATAGYSGGQVVVADDASARFGLDSSFGTSFGNAVHLMVGTNWEGVIVPTTNRAVTNVPNGATRLDFAVRNGQLAPAAQ